MQFNVLHDATGTTVAQKSLSVLFMVTYVVSGPTFRRCPRIGPRIFYRIPCYSTYRCFNPETYNRDKEMMHGVGPTEAYTKKENESSVHTEAPSHACPFPEYRDPQDLDETGCKEGATSGDKLNQTKCSNKCTSHIKQDTKDPLCENNSTAVQPVYSSRQATCTIVKTTEMGQAEGEPECVTNRNSGEGIQRRECGPMHFAKMGQAEGEPECVTNRNSGEGIQRRECGPMHFAKMKQAEGEPDCATNKNSSDGLQETKCGIIHYAKMKQIIGEPKCLTNTSSGDGYQQTKCATIARADLKHVTGELQCLKEAKSGEFSRLESIHIPYPRQITGEELSTNIAKAGDQFSRNISIATIHIPYVKTVAGEDSSATEAKAGSGYTERVAGESSWSANGRAGLNRTKVERVPATNKEGIRLEDKQKKYLMRPRLRQWNATEKKQVN